MGLFDKFKKKQKEEDNVAEKNDRGGFLGFVLLPENKFDWEQLGNTLREEWQIEPAFTKNEDGKYEESQVIPYKGCMIGLGLINMPVPEQEAEKNAAYNYMWQEAVEKTKNHKAHLLVSVLGNEISPFERGKIFVQVAASCCKQENVIGIYTSGCVFQPEFYVAAAEMLKSGELPLLNWIWFGIYQTEKGVGGYTFGLNNFGKDEIEVLDTSAEPDEVRDFLLNMAAYVLEENVTLHNGETIGFSAKQKLLITRNKGVRLEGMTLKIEYGKA